MSLPDRVKSAGTVIVTVLIFAVVVFWIVVVAARLGTPPVVDENGAVRYDEFVRAKDIFVLVLPLLTTAVGYWLGNQGTVKAEEKAAKAEARKDAVLAEGEPDLLEKARARYPQAWN